MLAGTQEATVGIYLAALNIARVPGFALAAAAVLLPSVSQANAVNDRALVERYINQALRFFLMAYLPVLVAALKEEVMPSSTAASPAAAVCCCRFWSSPMAFGHSMRS